MSACKRLHVIGAGRVGKTLAKLLALHAGYTIGGVLTQHAASAAAAVDFIGQGKPLTDYSCLSAADVIMITTPDDAIPAAVEQLRQLAVIQPGMIVLHCSGALNSHILAPLSAQGASIASLHPVWSFADLNYIIAHFSAIYCTLEGDDVACQTLMADIAKLTPHCLRVTAEQKLFLHTAMVIAANYFTTLMDAAVRTAALAGFSQSQALSLLQPLVRGACEQTFNLGPGAALTGPIVRNDVSTVQQELTLLQQHDASLAACYQWLGQATVSLALGSKRLTSEQSERLLAVLGSSD